jgi:hypothetical protein
MSLARAQTQPDAPSEMPDEPEPPQGRTSLSSVSRASKNPVVPRWTIRASSRWTR